MITINTQELTKDQFQYIVYYINEYAERKSRTTLEILDIFNQFGVIKYLTLGYEVLHSQGTNWLIADIDEYLKVRGVTV